MSAGRRVIVPRKRTMSHHGLRVRLTPAKIALVARDNFDMKKLGEQSKWGFGPFLSKVLTDCSRAKCDTVFFSPWTVGVTRKKWLFPPGTTHNVVILGVRRRRSDYGEHIQVWLRHRPTPVRIEQIFARSIEFRAQADFVDRFSERVFDKTCVMVCGESNILRTRRDSRPIEDPHGVLKLLKQKHVRVVFNPVHWYMRRWEMQIKRRALSRDNRWVISLWNRGFAKGGESKLPWQVFHNGIDVSPSVRPLARTVNTKFGLRIGVLEV